MSATVLGQRVLPGLAPYLDNAIVIVSSLVFDTNYTITLSLIAPGLAELPELQTKLCAWLKATLVSVDPDWVCDVTIEHFETGEPEIVVEINDAGLIGYRSLDQVLQTAELFVTLFAARKGRDVYVLKDAQCLVPLVFEPLTTSTHLEVVIPQPLSLQTPKQFAARQLTRNVLNDSVDFSMGSSSAARAFLEGSLYLAFERCPWIGSIAVQPSSKGVRVVVNFNDRPWPTPFEINTTQKTIMKVLEQHTTLDSVNNDLVFVSLTPVGDESDDYGDDYGDRVNE